MKRIEEVVTNRRISSEELDSLIRSESKSRVLKRLYFIKFRYLDNSEGVTNKIGVTKKTVYDCQKEWNQDDYTTLILD